MKKFISMFVIAAALCVTSCTTVTPITATSNPVGNKCGTSSSVRVLGLGGNANMGINSAAKMGGISRISHIDFKTFSFLGLYTQYTVLVYGE